MSTSLGNSEWKAFINNLETAEEEFVQGRPAAFLALWSHSDDVTLCGGFGGVERGWQNVTNRLAWVSAKYTQGGADQNKFNTIGAQLTSPAMITWAMRMDA